MPRRGTWSDRRFSPGASIRRGWDLARFQTEFASHFGAYANVDVALDTFPYHGTTTTCEALSMGVPVVTLAGVTHVSRVGVSLLTSVGLKELIAQSPEEYVKIAANLSRRPRTLEGNPRDAAGPDVEFTVDGRAAIRQRCRGGLSAGLAKVVRHAVAV